MKRTKEQRTYQLCQLGGLIETTGLEKIVDDSDTLLGLFLRAKSAFLKMTPLERGCLRKKGKQYREERNRKRKHSQILKRLERKSEPRCQS